MPKHVVTCSSCGEKFALRRPVGRRRVRCLRCGGLMGESAAAGQPDAAAPGPLKGKTIAACKLGKQIGAGAGFRTFRARREDTGVDVTVRVYPSGFGEQYPSFVREMFHRVARACSVKHPNVLAVVDLGRTEHYYFIVRESVEGPSLRQVLEKKGALTVQRCISITEDLLKGLQAIHAQGLSHGDVRPENIFLDYDGSAKLANTGIQPAPEELDEFYPSPGGFLTGPAYYASPERARARAREGIRSDLYSLGVTLFETLTGQAPHDGDSAEEIAGKHLHGPPDLAERARGVPEELCDFIRRLLAADAEDRPQTPSEALALLREVAVELSRQEKIKKVAAAFTPEQMRRSHKRVAIIWAAVCTALIVLTVIPVVWLSLSYRQGVRKSGGVRLEGGAARVFVLVEGGQDGAQPPPDELRDLLTTLAAYRLSACSGLIAVDPLMAAEITQPELSCAEKAERTGASYLLRIVYSRGFERWKWHHVLADRDEKLLRVSAECVTEGTRPEDFAAFDAAVSELVRKAARVIRPQTRPLGSAKAGSGEGWSDYVRAVRAERDGRWEDAHAAMGRACATADDEAGFAVLRAFYGAVISLKRSGKVAPSPAVETASVPDHLVLLQAALDALAGGKETAVSRAMARCLSEYPFDVRAHYLLALWRAHSRHSPGEALPAFRRAVEVDPGYLPALKAWAKLHAESGREPARIIDEYRSMNPTDKQMATFRQYCRGFFNHPQEKPGPAAPQ